MTFNCKTPNGPKVGADAQNPMNAGQRCKGLHLAVKASCDLPSRPFQHQCVYPH